MTTIAVTGAAGTVGTIVCAHLEARGHSVIAIDRIDGMPPQSRRADLTDPAATQLALAGADVVIHLAAINTPVDAEVMRNNLESTRNVLAASAALGITRIVLASSINAIGMAFSAAPSFDYFPVDTEHRARPEDAYSRSKHILEEDADEFCARHPEISVVSLRLHAVMSAEAARHQQTRSGDGWAVNGLWGYATPESVARAFELACTASVNGHEVLLVVAPKTFSPVRSARLAREHFPGVPLRRALWGHRGFFDTSRTTAVLGWKA